MLRENHNIKETSCMADRDIIRYLRRVAFKAAKKFNLRIKGLDKFPSDHANIYNTVGVCEHNNMIYVNIYNAETGAYYSIEALIDTTLHEVAHLAFKHGQHDKEFEIFFSDIKAWYYEEK